jgi:hypothetical protein
LRLSDEIHNPRKDRNVFNRVKKGIKTGLIRNIVEVTVSWNDIEINPEKFSKNDYHEYTRGPFRI